MTYYKTSLRAKHARLAIAPLALAVFIAGCGGGGGSGSTANNPYGAAAAPQKTATTSSAGLRLAGLAPGKALVDAQGRTLYLFEADHGTTSSCTGACASIWPPATASGKTAAGPGLSAAKISTTMRSDGQRQLTYNGHPLYRYAADAKAGDANGQGLDQFGGKWYVVDAGGAKIDND